MKNSAHCSHISEPLGTNTVAAAHLVTSYWRDDYRLCIHATRVDQSHIVRELQRAKAGRVPIGTSRQRRVKQKRKAGREAVASAQRRGAKARRRGEAQMLKQKGGHGAVAAAQMRRAPVMGQFRRVQAHECKCKHLSTVSRMHQRSLLGCC
jgi:hypothetical protein